LKIPSTLACLHRAFIAYFTCRSPQRLPACT
jgi:hypothetical protein